ncbi:hypothetical protein OC846_002792 [Tilletia horrida]|uniref:Uncharacterized protein n=1 Tax=Tilletia horrida TaxID=155126 RepID=A0AAN6GT20_9BASI|nr:hypothetical protein OC845_001654 [Tilletia horrida]KAK0552729.1 hypothetical protein OC846_002792 [Tilletia horrida]KAK0568437.1 hypothetical protein OC861_001918 [Tilletia horrida]
MSNNDEQTFTIQPHPAKTNDPSDPANGGAGTESNPTEGFQAAAQTLQGNNPGPAISTNSTTFQLEEPASKEDLAARSAELNKE